MCERLTVLHSPASSAPSRCIGHTHPDSSTASRSHHNDLPGEGRDALECVSQLFFSVNSADAVFAFLSLQRHLWERQNHTG